MPGHVKLVKGAVDPDPTEYLLPSVDMKKEDQNKPYEPKQSVWVPDPKTGGYREGLLLEGAEIASIGARLSSINRCCCVHGPTQRNI